MEPAQPEQHGSNSLLAPIPDTPHTSAHGQTKGFEVLPPNPNRGVVNVVNGICEGNPRSMGGSSSAALFASIFEQNSNDAHSARVESNKKQVIIDELRENLSKERIDKAALTERINGLKNQYTYTQLCMTLGAVLVGVAVDGVKSGSILLAAVTGMTALTIIIGCWVIPRLRG